MTASGYERIVKYRINKRLKGECLWPGCHLKAGYLCPEHLKRANEVNRRAYAKRRLTNGK